jgi:phenylalanyl-tRNA synthetase beta subunit
MTVSYKWLQTFFNSPLPSPNKLAEILTAHFFEVESVEKKGIDYAINIDVLPDRAGDCLSHYGIAREISVLLDKKLLFRAIKLRRIRKRLINILPLRLKTATTAEDIQPEF